MRPLTLAIGAVALITFGHHATAGPCFESWDVSIGNPGFNDTGMSLFVFDEGAGPALFAGGSFTQAGAVGANGIARWNGLSWSALGDGLGPGGGVSAMASFDDGSGGGPALYASGEFASSGVTAVNNVARWDGSGWQPLGSGVNAAASGGLAVFDDGTGPALYVGGAFTMAGGVAAPSIARWDGTAWSGVAGGMAGAAQPSVFALAVFDDGSGPALYAGGAFTTAGGVSASRIARWDGTSWSSVGTGTNNLIRTLAVIDDGSGPALYAGGDFTMAGGVAANRIARWDGTSWSALGGGASATVRSIVGFDDGLGGGPQVYAGGEFQTAGGVAVNRVARWDGLAWHALGSGMNDGVQALAVFDDDGTGPSLFAAGAFDQAGDTPASGIARWEPCGPEPVPGDITGDGVIDGIDLGVLLANWSIPVGSPGCEGAAFCPADLDENGVVDGIDLGMLLGFWLFQIKG